MRKILLLLVALFAVYTGYWFIGATASEKGIQYWVDARAQEGWQAEAREVRTKGFPFAFATRIEEPVFADPALGVAFAADFVLLESATFKPTDFSAKISKSARISTPNQKIDISHEQADLALHVAPDTNLTLISSAFELQNVALQSSFGWGLQLDSGQFSTQTNAENDLAHNIQFSAAGFRPTGGFLSQFKGSEMLTDQFEHLSLKAQVTFEKPWDIDVLAGPRPQPRFVALEEIRAQWGELELRLAGDFNIDAQGYPVGTLAVKAVNWREMIEILKNAGVLPDNLARLASRGGELVAGISGRPDTIDADLTLKNGMITLGFIPLGPAPRLVIR